MNLVLLFASVLLLFYCCFCIKPRIHNGKMYMYTELCANAINYIALKFILYSSGRLVYFFFYCTTLFPTGGFWQFWCELIWMFFCFVFPVLPALSSQSYLPLSDFWQGPPSGSLNWPWWVFLAWLHKPVNYKWFWNSSTRCTDPVLTETWGLFFK